MEIKVVEVYFKEPKLVPLQGGGFYYKEPYAPIKAGITVEVDGELLYAKSTLIAEMSRHVPYEQIMRELRHHIMRQVEKRIFNDFNVRS